jgi:hypothetical protein
VAGLYDFSVVDATIDPPATTFDFDNDTNNDYFLSFVISMGDIVNQLGNKGIAFDEDSQFQLVAGTSTQPNALNQDLGGPDGGTTSTETWEDLGAMTRPFSPSMTPEPDTGALFGLGLIVLAAAKRRRRF